MKYKIPPFIEGLFKDGFYMSVKTTSANKTPPVWSDEDTLLIALFALKNFLAKFS